MLAAPLPALAQVSSNANSQPGSFSRTGAVSIVSGSSVDASTGIHFGSGTSTAAHSSSVAATVWLLCPPTGVSDTQPFLVGTDISCAP